MRVRLLGFAIVSVICGAAIATAASGLAATPGAEARGLGQAGQFKIRLPIAFRNYTQPYFLKTFEGTIEDGCPTYDQPSFFGRCDNGEFRLTFTSPGSVLMELGGDTSQDYEVSVDLRLSGSADDYAGLAFGLSPDRQSGFTFTLSPTGMWQVQGIGGGTVLTPKAAASFNPSGVNRLRLRWQPGVPINMYCYLNDTYIGGVAWDPNIPRGITAALYARANSSGFDARFDNFSGYPGA